MVPLNESQKKINKVNYEVRDIPERVNNILNVIAKIRGKNKWEIIKEALEEYAANHIDEVKEFVGKKEMASATEVLKK